MGAEQSKSAAPAPPDPCTREIEAYLKCVEAQTAASGGLRDGEECEAESETYRECRRKAREAGKALRK